MLGDFSFQILCFTSVQITAIVPPLWVENLSKRSHFSKVSKFTNLNSIARKFKANQAQHKKKISLVTPKNNLLELVSGHEAIMQTARMSKIDKK